MIMCEITIFTLSETRSSTNAEDSTAAAEILKENIKYIGGSLA